MRHEIGSTIRPDPIAFFLTWTTYGSWLPGDARGWVDRHGVIREPRPGLARSARLLLRHPPVVFDASQRTLVEEAVREHCRFRCWPLHAVHCRTTHVHAVVSAPDKSPQTVVRCVKAWCSRQLAARYAAGGAWWSKGGSARMVYDTQGLEDVVTYVVEGQDKPRR